MSDILKNLFNPFTERAKSPLIGSFIVSWCIFNWEILYTTLFLSNETISPDNKLDYVSRQLNWCDSGVCPLLTALAYIFIYPHVDKLILKYTERLKREKIDEKIRIGREHSVQGNLYYDLKIKFEEEKNKILKAESNTKKLKAKIKELETTISQKQNQIDSQNEIVAKQEIKLNNYWNRSELKDKFQGRWTVYYNDPNNKIVNGAEEVDIRDNKYLVIKNNTEFHAFEIRLFDYDYERKKVSFVKQSTSPNRAHLINELTIISNDRFEGVENGTIKITYQRRIIT